MRNLIKVSLFCLVASYAGSAFAICECEPYANAANETSELNFEYRLNPQTGANDKVVIGDRCTNVPQCQNGNCYWRVTITNPAPAAATVVIRERNCQDRISGMADFADMIEGAQSLDQADKMMSEKE